ncbi:MAG: cob(I)yrinic acid a,c-diamide adenosyltransferase [Lachnospiraceae bacterium]|nr:cob(I)yrinic acid a,c-diamide adenosyltransferase [Lachnospiraceae bacterium]
MEKGIIQVYYGNGSGKSSAAFGNVVRRVSAGACGYIIRFLKGQIDEEYMKKLEPEIKLFSFERSIGGFDSLTEEKKLEEKQNILNGINFAKKVLTTGECDVLVLDEVLGIVDEGIATVEEILGVLQERSIFTTVILTGRNLPDEIREVADQIMRIDSEKEPEESKS